MNRTTLKDIHNAIKDISVQNRLQYPEHLQIKSFGFGNVSEINTIEIDGVYLFLQPTISNITSNITQINFNLYVMDLIDENNSLDVLNDTLLIITDIAKFMTSTRFKKRYGFKMMNSVNVTAFNGAFEQQTAGWVSEIQVEVFNGSTCKTSFVHYYDVDVVDVKGSWVLDYTGDLFNMIEVGDMIWVTNDGVESLTEVLEISQAGSSTITRLKVDQQYFNVTRIRIKNI